MHFGDENSIGLRKKRKELQLDLTPSNNLHKYCDYMHSLLQCYIQFKNLLFWAIELAYNWQLLGVMPPIH